jgi:hypothetical protein
MKQPEDLANWPDPKLRMKADLDAVGIPEDTVAELVNGQDHPQAVPIMVDWLEHLDERVPPEDRRAWRAGLLRNLITNYARGNQRAVDVVLAQFDIDPPLSPLELEAATWAVAEIAAPSDFERVARIITDHPWGRRGSFQLIQWLGKVHTPEAARIAVQALENPRTRKQAMRALARQRAVGVRADVARYLDDDEPVFRKEAEKALAKLPEE